ncbi:MAG: ABC transporter permease [Actinomycetota bacterium]|nr:ABC transporter permease [Actinomycetota bacterium]
MSSSRTTTPATVATAGSRWAMVVRQFDYWLTVYRRTWKGSAVSSFVMPLIYVGAMGVLLGGYVDSSTAAGSADLQGAPSYLAYVAPGLVAAHAMQTATGEVMWPVMGMIKWNRAYYGMIATPLSVADVVAAQLLFVLFRVATSCGVFLVVLAFFGVYESLLGAVGAFFVQMLLGLAFATPLFAFSAGLRSEAGFAVIYRVVIVPLFLFSGAFFPIANLSAPLEWLARLTPLWHGVDLTRMLTLGQLDWSLAAVHLLYLAVLAAGGWWWTVRRLTNRLVD